VAREGVVAAAEVEAGVGVVGAAADADRRQQLMTRRS